ncbi:hypothetical protein LGN17_21210 [Burkholderia sp. AU30280]|nr:hypothetical protein [Burkholderia sp. AU30280]
MNGHAAIDALVHRVACPGKSARPASPTGKYCIPSIARKHLVRISKAFRDHAPVANDSPKRRIASAYSKTFPDQPARREVMRRVSVAVLCAAAFVAACSDDAPHDAHATDASQQAGASAGSASAFNNDAVASTAASDAAPLAPPVVHYPPDDDDDAKPTANAAASSAAASSPG